MANAAPEPVVWRVDLPDEAATDAFGRELAAMLAPGDLVTLSGGLGAGKTTLARAIVRALAEDPVLEVPSPTFTLMQTYDGTACPVVHADLFRVRDPEELTELGWDEAARDAIVLVEWPDRAGHALTAERFDVELTGGAEGGRTAFVTAVGPHGARLARASAIHDLLAGAGWLAAERRWMLGDASTRAYERLTLGDRTAILMISPRRPDGPPIRNGLPYSTIAKLAESVHAFVAMDKGLASLDLSVPTIHAQDLETGLLLIEDLGSEPVVERGAPIPERYAAAAEVLAAIHARTLPRVLPIREGLDHEVPDYDLDALMIEVDLLVEWYVPHIARASLPSSARREFVAAWTEVLGTILEGPRTWTLRDYHSPNLIWLPMRQGLARVGLIDFQDAVIGHPAYDVASLLQDARVTVPQDLELKLLSHYAATRRAAFPGFDTAAFTAAYAILGAQRATKIAGIFARLDKRDGKPRYLEHLPRVEAYLVRDLAHPVLGRLKLWYETHLPRLFAAP